MIFNRTQNDVTNAISIRNNKIKLDPITKQPIDTTPLTDIEKVILSKGFMTIETLNRIENKQTELKTGFNNIGYYNISIQTKQWEKGDIFHKSDFQRILNNENILKNALFIYQNTPDTPNISFYYEDINSIEKILYDLENMIDTVKNNYRECGTFHCGEE